MKIHDFIFSNRRSALLKRHAAFWLLWWLYFMFTYFLPDHQFPGWVISNARMEHGFFMWSVQMCLQSLSLMFNLVLFTYTVIYFLLPQFFLKGKYLFFGIGVLFTAITVFFLTWVEYIYYNRQVGLLLTGKANPLTLNYIINCTLNFMLFNLPAVAGIALTIKMMKRWYLKQEETDQVVREKTSAELQLLKARIHPHFLFNSLNNIYSFALEASPKTPEMIQKLSGLLQYMLYECIQHRVPVEKELQMLRDYIALENIRYGERLKLDVLIPQDQDQQMIAPLLLIPFVENSFKHGTSKMLSDPKISLQIHLDNHAIYFQLTNNKPFDQEEIPVNGNRGLGLKNVKKRLALLYPNRHELQITEDNSSYTVRMKISLSVLSSDNRNANGKKKQAAYELA